MPYLKPIEIRVTRHPNGGYTYYTILKVYSGIANTAHVNRKFMTRVDAANWCKTEYPNVPVIYE